MAECHVIDSEKPNAFLIILEVILRFGLEKHQETTGSIRYFYQLFWMLPNTVLLTVFDVSQSRKTHSFLLENLMLFGTFWGIFAKVAPKVCVGRLIESSQLTD